MPEPGDAVLEKLVGFGRVLRDAGLEVGPGRLQDALRGLDVVGLTAATRSTTRCAAPWSSRREEIDAFDAAFAAYWERAPRTPATGTIGLEAPRLEPSRRPRVIGREADGGGDETTRRRRCCSSTRPTSCLRRRDFADMSRDRAAAGCGG